MVVGLETIVEMAEAATETADTRRLMQMSPAFRNSCTISCGRKRMTSKIIVPTEASPPVERISHMIAAEIRCLLYTLEAPW